MGSRDSMIFYRSFYESGMLLRPRDRGLLFEAILKYQFTGEKSSLPDAAMAAWVLIEPILESNNQRYENGQKGKEHGAKGGRPPKKNNPIGDIKNSNSENPIGDINIDSDKTPNKDKDKDKDKEEEEVYNHNPVSNIYIPDDTPNFTDADVTLNEGLKSVSDWYSKSTGKLLSSVLIADVQRFLQVGADVELIQYALNISLSKGNPASYFRGVMQNKIAGGIKTYQQLMDAENANKPTIGAKAESVGNPFYQMLEEEGAI